MPLSNTLEHLDALDVSVSDLHVTSLLDACLHTAAQQRMVNVIPCTLSKSYYELIFIYILKINENATLVFSISFLHGLVNQSFVLIKQLYLTYCIKKLLFVLIDCQYAWFKIACSKTSYPTPYYVAHE